MDRTNSRPKPKRKRSQNDSTLGPNIDVRRRGPLRQIPNGDSYRPSYDRNGVAGEYGSLANFDESTPKEDLRATTTRATSLSAAPIETPITDQCYMFMKTLQRPPDRRNDR